MKGYKGFNKGLVAKGKQYAENTIFEEKNAVIGHSGMRFCENPFDVLDYYPLIDDDGTPNEFAEVEALADVQADGLKKHCTTKLKICARLTLSGFIKAAVDFVFEKCKGAELDFDDFEQFVASGDFARIATSIKYAQLAAAGDDAQLAVSGDDAKLAASGDDTQLAASGNNAQLAASGNNAQLAASGNNAKLAASSHFAKLAVSGDDAKLAVSGDFAQLAASGDFAKLAAAGDDAQLAASGHFAKLAVSGDDAKLTASGDSSIVAGIGINNIAKAALGCWITLAEWEHSEEKRRWIPRCVKTEFVDGERIKADVFYKLQDGEFKEVAISAPDASHN